MALLFIVTFLYSWHLLCQLSKETQGWFKLVNMFMQPKSFWSTVICYKYSNLLQMKNWFRSCPKKIKVLQKVQFIWMLISCNVTVYYILLDICIRSYLVGLFVTRTVIEWLRFIFWQTWNVCFSRLFMSSLSLVELVSWHLMITVLFVTRPSSD